MRSESVAPSPIEISNVLREIREVMHLEENDPRRIAAMAEKQRILNITALDRYHTTAVSL
jgi:hypothetical protein